MNKLEKGIIAASENVLARESLPTSKGRKALRYLGKKVAIFGRFLETIGYYIGRGFEWVGFHIYYLRDAAGRDAIKADVQKAAEDYSRELMEAIRGASDYAGQMQQAPVRGFKQ